MARRILVPAGTSGASSSGAGGGGLIAVPGSVDTHKLTGLSYEWATNYAGLSQLNANQFMYVVAGKNNSTNTIRWSAQAFTVDNNGNITEGSSSYVQNSSGTSTSTHQGGETAPGSHSHISRWHYNGTYYINHAQFHVNNNNQIAAIDRHSPGDYNSGYAHPTSGCPIASGAWTGTSGTRYVWYMGYNTSGHGTYTGWQDNGNYTQSTVNTYSSTGFTGNCMKWHGDSSAGMGYMSDHRSSTSGWYYNVVYSGTSVTSLGYQNNVFGNTGAEQEYQNCQALSWVAASPSNNNNRGVLFNTVTGGCCAHNKNGSGQTGMTMTGSYPFGGDVAWSRGNHASFACGKNTFVIPVSNDYGSFTELSVSGWQPNLDLLQNTLIQSIPGFYDADTHTSSNPTRTRCRIGGNQNQFLVSVVNGNIKVYDISSNIDLSSYA